MGQRIYDARILIAWKMVLWGYHMFPHGFMKDLLRNALKEYGASIKARPEYQRAKAELAKQG